VFDLPRRFALDLGELERRYLALCRETHPDRFVNAGPAERVAALQAARDLNEAYRTLRKPVPRAEHLLAAHGLSIADKEALDPEFLSEILEAREELLDAKLAGQDERLAELRGAMAARRDAVLGTVASEFHAVETSGSADTARREAGLGRIKRALILLRYIDRYLEQLEDAEA
jgi:molecular chaperone HscB